MRTRTKLLGTLLLAALALGAAGAYFVRAHDGGPKRQPKPAPAVTVTTPRSRDLPVQFNVQGHLVALNQVDIRPQVAGVIRQVTFQEGDDIRAGQLLFTLDDTEATSQLRRFEGNAAQVRAQLDDAVRALDRANDLLKAKFIAQSAVDSAASKVETLRAQLAMANAEVDTARTQLGYTRIVSPLAGKAGALNVHPGSLAQPAAAVPLVTIAQFDPIGVDFSLPEADLGAVLAARGAGTVKVAVETSNGQRIEGPLSFVNNTVTTGSGTISLKAALPNARQLLWPGSYVKVTVYAGTERAATVLPAEALLEGPTGRFVYVLDPNDTVVARPVELVRVQDQLAIIRGVGSGDRVVLEGNQSVAAGDKVRISSQTAVATP
jgi:RND family efflux transporter MFP subunit